MCLLIKIKKLRLSGVSFWVLGCFLVLELESFCGLRLLGWALVWLAVFYGLFAFTAGWLAVL
jgi:hypothetical protein